MAEAEQPVAAGVVLELGPNLLCRVLLDSGDVVTACIPRRTARLMFRVAPSDRVQVRARGAGFVVVGPERDRAE